MARSTSRQASRGKSDCHQRHRRKCDVDRPRRSADLRWYPTRHAYRASGDPNGVVRNASQGFGGAARQAIVNAGEKPTNLKGRGSLDLSQGGIQSPKRARREVSRVRTVSTNPFENTENSAPGMGVSVVRKGDNGGGGGSHLTFQYDPSLFIFSFIPLNNLSTIYHTCPEYSFQFCGLE
jgi:hypothetical protein